MLRDALGQTYRKVIFSQAILTALLSVAALVIAGAMPALSALIGGAAVIVGSIAYAALARESKVSMVSAGRVLTRHLMAEAAKVLLVLTLVFASLASGWFVAGWLIAAMAVALLGQWLALLIIR
jgi:F0F1-type ATP synthase assembly protein I